MLLGLSLLLLIPLIVAILAAAMGTARWKTIAALSTDD
jgi:hypothetical protein